MRPLIEWSPALRLICWLLGSLPIWRRTKAHCPVVKESEVSAQSICCDAGGCFKGNLRTA